MIAFGTVLAEPEPYRRYAEPGIRRAAEPDSVVHAFAASGPMARGYNLMLDAAARHADLEALVLIHPHAEIADPAFCAKVRKALRDPAVAVVGCAGATGVRGAAWWEGDVHAGDVVHRYTEYGGGEVRAYGWAEAGPVPAAVDAVDGMLLVLAAWAVRNVRFDEGLVLGSGFEVDFCGRVREAGRAVLAADLRVVEHRSLELVGDGEVWAIAHQQLAAKWEGRPPGAPPQEVDWPARARRAEAEAEAMRAVAYSRALVSEARLSELERAFAQATASRSWRLTEPLRRLNKLRGELRGGRRAERRRTR